MSISQKKIYLGFGFGIYVQKRLNDILDPTLRFHIFDSDEKKFSPVLKKFTCKLMYVIKRRMSRILTEELLGKLVLTGFEGLEGP